jgi:hypothetical protein
MSPCDLRFYDNDLDNFKGFHEMCPVIETICINDRIPVYFGYHPHVDRTSYRKIMETYYPEDDCLYNVLEYYQDVEQYEPCEGITEEQGKDLLAWVDRRCEGLHHRKIVFFDWDRTLTCTEGLFCKRDIVRNKITVPAVVHYLFGPPTRLYRLRQLIDVLREKGVEMYILTNNQLAMQDKLYFSQFVKEFHSYFKPRHILVSCTFPTKQACLKKFLLTILNESSH